MRHLSKQSLLIIVLSLICLVLCGLVWHMAVNESQRAITAERDMLEAEQSRLLDSYNELRGQVNVRLGRGQDARYFITPDDPAVAAMVQEITGGYAKDERWPWRGYGDIYLWVITNIEYTSDAYTPILPELGDGTVQWEKGFWKTPAETLNDGTGDCEDISALLVSMMLHYSHRQFPIWILGIRTDGSDAKSHVAVAVLVENSKMAIIDPSGHYYSVFPIGWGITADY